MRTRAMRNLSQATALGAENLASEILCSVKKRKGEKKKQENNFLGTEKIGKLMKQYAIPCMISLLVGALYNIVDQIFIANASYLGSYGNAANTVVFPLTVVALATTCVSAACAAVA